MKKIKPNITKLIPILLVIGLTSVACNDFAGPIEALDNPMGQVPADKQYTESNDNTLFFNPQPEPPAQIFEFETTGLVEDRLEGRFRNKNFSGRVSIETLSSVRRGRSLHLVQLWILHPPDPIHPMHIKLKGILNLAKDRIVMNGQAESDGMLLKKDTNVHVRGEFTDTGNGSISVGGELMFNPQPEPPALNN